MVLRITVHSEAATTHSIGVATPSVTSTAEGGPPRSRNAVPSSGLLTAAAKKPREMIKSMFHRDREDVMEQGVETNSRCAVSAIDDVHRAEELTVSLCCRPTGTLGASDHGPLASVKPK